METKDLIQNLESEILAKRLMLKALKADQKERNSKLFAETKFGKLYLCTVKAVTKPFNSMHQNASAMLDRPAEVVFTELEQDGTKLTKETKKVPVGDKKATAMANRCAKLLLEMEILREKYKLQIPGGSTVMEDLKDEMRRLRPAINSRQFETVEVKLDQMIVPV